MVLLEPDLDPERLRGGLDLDGGRHGLSFREMAWRGRRSAAPAAC
jgi:hypothetical protein